MQQLFSRESERAISIAAPSLIKPDSRAFAAAAALLSLRRPLVFFFLFPSVFARGKYLTRERESKFRTAKKRD